jgi:Mg2+ and Co2+ transporter CorA
MTRNEPSKDTWISFYSGSDVTPLKTFEHWQLQEVRQKLHEKKKGIKRERQKMAGCMHQIRISKALILRTRKTAFLGAPEFWNREIWRSDYRQKREILAQTDQINCVNASRCFHFPRMTRRQHSKIRRRSRQRVKYTVEPTSQPTHSYAVNAHYRKPGFGEENKTHSQMTITIITKKTCLLQFRFTVLSLNKNLDCFQLSQN